MFFFGTTSTISLKHLALMALLGISPPQPAIAQTTQQMEHYKVYCDDSPSVEFEFDAVYYEVHQKYLVVIFQQILPDGEQRWGKLTMGDETCKIVVKKEK